MTLSFEDARKIVADSALIRSLYPADDFEVAPYGWESDSEFRMLAGTHRDVTGEGDFRTLTIDPPVVFVVKETGVVRLWYGNRRDIAAMGMTPVGER